MPTAARARLMAEALCHATSATRDELAAEMLERACQPQNERISGRQRAAEAEFMAAFVSVYDKLTIHAQGAARAVSDVDWSPAVSRLFVEPAASLPVGGIMAAVDLNCGRSILELARDAVCPEGSLTTAPDAVAQNITQVCAGLAARIATAESTGDAPAILGRIVFVLSTAAATVDQHKQDVVLEMIAEVFARLKVAGGRVAAQLAGEVLAEADRPAAILFRNHLRKAKPSRWNAAAISLLGVPSVALAAAERLLKFDPAMCDELAARSHVFLHPARLAALRRQMATIKSKSSPIMTAIQAGQCGERVAAALIAVIVPAATITRASTSRQTEINGITEAIGRLASSKDASIRHAALRSAIICKMSPQVLEACFDPSASIARSATIAVVFARGCRSHATTRVLEALGRSGHRDVRRLIERATLRPSGMQSYAWPEGDDAVISRKLCGLRGRVIDLALAEALAGFVTGEAKTDCPKMPRTAAAALPLLARSGEPVAADAINDALTAPDARIRSAAFEAMAVGARLSADDFRLREAKLTLRAGLGDGHHRVRGSCIRAVVALDPDGEHSREAATRVICEMVESKFSLNQRAAMWAVSAVAAELAGDARVQAAVQHVRHNPADEAAIWRAERAGLGLRIFSHRQTQAEIPAAEEVR